MAKAKRCDRCNAYFQIATKQPNAVTVGCIDYSGSVDSTFSSCWRDLCPECMDAFNAWMKSAMKEVQFVES